MTQTAGTRRRRPEPAAFLRSRRARVTPADVGMPPGLRRRTPGLRREEVAHPAVVYNARYDVLATNPAYLDLFDTPAVRSTGLRNTLWALFTRDEAECPVRFRETELPMMVAQLRQAYGSHAGEPAREDFVRELSAASPYFARLWRSGNVVKPGPRVKTFRHRKVGEIRMTSVSLSIDGMPECRIVAYTPAGEESSARTTALRAQRQD
ncbi:MmyB family transcriptional regulator [Streptomyces cavernicola]|uniref:MmyB-like transcription regulator ligand binding domain-containing protein n=1 Tax=Streptomyces cavernicola TaxID=3043613 RepID=A0ABT6SDY3_9ACTN|nr:hypothetical protein [Streptomyces sp. B-S-A6]MDI3406396.1 hypothetical protein [Streptomyces sp. B-S-A6]